MKLAPKYEIVVDEKKKEAHAVFHRLEKDGRVSETLSLDAEKLIDMMEMERGGGKSVDRLQSAYKEILEVQQRMQNGQKLPAHK